MNIAAEPAERHYTWAKAPGFIRPPHPIPASHLKLLGLVGVATLLGAYDLQIFGLAAKQILPDFGLSENMTGPTVAIFRLGVFGALLLCLAADVIGRRRLLLFTVLGMALSTLATAFAPDYQTFLIAQFMVRIFAYTEDMLCVVVLAEEIEERSRGWAIGTLGALGALGAGVAVLVFALVNLLPFGWRSIYVLGAIPLLLLAWLRRRLPETKRFQEQAAAREAPMGVLDAWRPLVTLIRLQPGRLGLMMLSIAPVALGVASALVLMPTFLQSRHGWSPGAISMVVIGTGAVGVLAGMWIGRVSDRIGRRPTIATGVLLTLGGCLTLYLAEAEWLLAVGILFSVLGNHAVSIQSEAYCAELFPTAYRATAAALRFIAQILTGAIGLLVQGAVLAPLVGFGDAVLILLCPVPLALIAVYFLPETAGRTLEDLAPIETAAPFG